MTKLSVVAPFFNEEAAAAHFSVLLTRLEHEISRRFGLSLETVLVDDGSTDGSANAFAANLSGNWKIVQLSRNFGKEVAILAGLENATGDLVMLMDADLQHSADTALEMIAAMLSDSEIDVVHAVRSDGRTGWKRTQAARLFYRLINISQRFDIPENSGDFRIMRRPVADALVRLRDKRRFNKGLYAWAGFRQRAIPYRPVERVAGASKWSRLNLVALSIEGFTSFSVVPLRIVSGIGFLIAIAGILYGIKIVIEVLTTGIAVPGFPSLFVAIVVLGGFNLALLGLVGEYVWAALSEAKDRPIYLVRDVIQPAAPAQEPSPQHHRGKTH